jgi:hypothetical protein
MVKFYSKANQTSNVCMEATKAFSCILKSLQENGKKFIKVLEVGAGLYSPHASLTQLLIIPSAGTGLLTCHLIEELKQHPDLLVEYTVTDISYTVIP